MDAVPYVVSDPRRSRGETRFLLGKEVPCVGLARIGPGPARPGRGHTSGRRMGRRQPVRPPPVHQAQATPGACSAKEKKLCVECQRAKLRAQGIQPPAPPPLATGGRDGKGGQGHDLSPGHGRGSAVVAAMASSGYAVVAAGRAISIRAVVQERCEQPGTGSSASSDRSVMRLSLPPPADRLPRRRRAARTSSRTSWASETIGRDRREDAERRSGTEHASIRLRRGRHEGGRPRLPPAVYGDMVGGVRPEVRPGSTAADRYDPRFDRRPDTRGSGGDLARS